MADALIHLLPHALEETGLIGQKKSFTWVVGFGVYGFRVLVCRFGRLLFCEVWGYRASNGVVPWKFCLIVLALDSHG